MRCHIADLLTPTWRTKRWSRPLLVLGLLLSLVLVIILLPLSLTIVLLVRMPVRTPRLTATHVTMIWNAFVRAARRR